jgi:hypothetical protein
MELDRKALFPKREFDFFDIIMIEKVFNLQQVELFLPQVLNLDLQRIDIHRQGWSLIAKIAKLRKSLSAEHETQG